MPEMAADIKTRNMLGAGYITRIPSTIKYFILANAGHKIKNDRYGNKEARTLAESYRTLGQAYLAANNDCTDAEINALSAYCVMLDESLKQYGLLRPDYKPSAFKSTGQAGLSGGDSSQEEQTESADAETVSAHLRILSGDDREIYCLLTKKLVALAKQKNPERDYEQLEACLKE